MCYSSQPPPNPSPVEVGSTRCSRYCLCMLGTGLVTLGVIVMVSLEQQTWDSSRLSLYQQFETHSKLTPVAFILMFAGTAMLMISVCLWLQNKQRQERNSPMQDCTSTTEQRGPTEQRGTTEVAGQVPRYGVPSYEEVMTSGQYPIQQSNLRSSGSQLPSYDDLVESGAVTEPPAAIRSETFIPSSSLASPESTFLVHPKYQDNHTTCKLLPLREQRIHSKTLNLDEHPALADPLILEPLTPPPQYEESPPEF
ncbi:transmembrane protein 51a [Scleropages formosus]|uniref:transmembrane protein 51a n=1 Tax=Scleropages formosus TaxID=113540 RepID=UPI0010FACBB6|nr:transmembrane protein 51-like [Scleropages formosus]XP_018592088.2 transmembrane protein 51-like [Scleropages formosus]XP_018592089.2 transmembrane protein 51-like [Scleropages formosus]XP_018592090.2 transmembrane protein 51-like [Scleropages formosus]XP_018592092.2 transmembrane protein 51-like [Scleropages formosus]XP_029104358.1 transmembrane protein 51-like [Scleropages formosus]